MATFEIYEDAAGEYRWRMKSGSDIIADSGEGYSSRDGARAAVRRIKNYAPDADTLDMGFAAFELYEDKRGEFRWRLRHRNGNILADSGEGYSSKSGAREAIASVKENSPEADTEESD
ncbi:MAG: HVO_2922 family protein [Halobacteriales archaeon]